MFTTINIYNTQHNHTTIKIKANYIKQIAISCCYSIQSLTPTLCMYRTEHHSWWTNSLS